MTEAPADAYIVYDGDCPVCGEYVAHMRLRKALGAVKLVNARDGGPEVAEIEARGLDLDEGMAMKLGGRVYHGADCVHAMALLSSQAGWFNRLNAFLFRSPAFSRAAYPLLAGARRLLLALRGTPLIHGHPPSED